MQTLILSFVVLLLIVAGMAVGVGSSKILGRIHIADLEIGGTVLPCSFTVLEDNKVDLLFGLDNLKRH